VILFAIEYPNVHILT